MPLSRSLEKKLLPEQKIEALQDVLLFKGIPELSEFIKEVAPLMTYHTFESGHCILEEGKEGEKLFILIAGEVYVQKKTPDGDVYNVTIINSDSKPAIGEGGLIDKSPRSATVKCKSDCAFLELTQENFTHFCDKHPQWGLALYRNIFKILIRRLRKMNTDLMLLHKALTDEIRGAS